MLVNQCENNTPFYTMGAILDFLKVTCLCCKQTNVVTVKHSKTSDMLHVLQDYRYLDIEIYAYFV